MNNGSILPQEGRLDLVYLNKIEIVHDHQNPFQPEKLKNIFLFFFFMKLMNLFTLLKKCKTNLITH